MTKEEIITHFTTNIKDYQRYAHNIAGEDSEDLFQMCSLMLLEFSEDRLISYWNDTQALKPFFLRMLCNQYKSVTSKYHKDYRKQEQNAREKAEEVVRESIQREEILIPTSYYDKISEACRNIYSSAISKEVGDIGRMVWDIYIESASLRKTQAIVESKCPGLSLDLKQIHNIVKHYQNSIKDHLENWYLQN